MVGVLTDLQIMHALSVKQMLTVVVIMILRPIVFSNKVPNVKEKYQDFVKILHQVINVVPVQMHLIVEETQTQTHIVQVKRLDLVHPQPMDTVHMMQEKMLVKHVLLQVTVVETHVIVLKVNCVLLVTVQTHLLKIVANLVKMNTNVEIQILPKHIVKQPEKTHVMQLIQLTVPLNPIRISVAHVHQNQIVVDQFLLHYV